MMTCRQLVLVGFVSLTLAACGIGIEGSGIRDVDTRDLPAFDRIDAEGTGQLAVAIDGVARDTIAVEVEGDDNLVPLVSTAVIDGELVIRLETDTPLDETIPLRLRVTMPALTRLRSSDSIDVRVAGLSGESFVLASTGSSDVTLAGAIDWLEIDSSDSADVHARELSATDAAVTASDTSDVEVCTHESLTVEASGSSDVTYYCSPTSIERHVSDSADVTAG
jgi:hypothetical protein